MSGPVRIANTQLAGFDLGQKLGAVQSLAGARTGLNTTIQALSTNLHYGPDGTQLNDLSAVVSSLGSASGAGTITPAGGLNFHLLVKLDSGGVGQIASQTMNMLPGIFGTAVSQATKNGIPVTIAGTTADPMFAPDVSRLGSVLPGKSSPQSNPLGDALGKLIHR